MYIASLCSHYRFRACVFFFSVIVQDTTKLQRIFRKAFWKIANDDKKAKREFYWWAINLYRASLYHSMPIPRIDHNINKPCSIYHGLNNVFIVDEQVPIYNGPISTTLTNSVARTFSEEKGLLWTITPSYANLFRFIIGIQVAWISQYKNEAEILLVNQYLPIGSTQNFEVKLSNKVDLLMEQLIKFKNKITNAAKFFDQIGLNIEDDWIDLIRTHKKLSDPSAYENHTVLQRLAEELRVEKLIGYWELHQNIFTNIFRENLQLQKNQTVINLNWENLKQTKIDKNHVIANKYYITKDEASQITKDVNQNYVYEFDDVHDVSFLIPFSQKTDNNKWGIYVQAPGMDDYVIIKEFTIYDANETSNTQISFLMNVLRVYELKITNPQQFCQRINIIMSHFNE